ETEVRIHDYGDGPNIHKRVALQFGDVEEGFAEADYVREDVFFYQGNNHLAMEQHSAIGVPSPDGKITLYTSTQTPHYVHPALAKVLELPASQIRVIALAPRGGVGGKTDPFPHQICPANPALPTGRPAKIPMTRAEVADPH